MNLKTPLGDIKIYIDGNLIDYKYYKIENEKNCLELSGRYIINVYFEPDGNEHRISCCIGNYKKTSRDEIETGENLELKSFYKDNIKLSIGMEGDTSYSKDLEREVNYYEYDNGYLDNGVEYRLLKHTTKKFKNYTFAIAWIENYNKENEVQTWLGADPTGIKMDNVEI